MQRAAQTAPYVPPVDAVRILEAMGFEAGAARRALVTTHGDVAAAATKLAAEEPATAAAGEGHAPFTAEAIAAAVSAAAAASSSSSAAAAAPEGFDTDERARIDESGLQHSGAKLPSLVAAHPA